MKPKPATPTARRLKFKLEVLAARGVNGEATAAQSKLTRLLARYDFNAPQKDLRDLFKGTFITSTTAEQVAPLDSGAMDVASFVKWSVETRCAIPCLFRDGKLYAQATRKTAQRLATIATSISDSFVTLWREYEATPGANRQDRAVFLRGLYDGVMGEELNGDKLPSRAPAKLKTTRAKKGAIAIAPGLQAHPYTIALKLGKQITLCVPLPEIQNQLSAAIKGELTEG